MKSAFRVDLGSISTDDNNPYSTSTAFLLMATNNLHTLGFSKFLEWVRLKWWWGITGNFKAGTLSGGSSIQRLWHVMTLPMCTGFILTYHGGWLKQRYFWKCDLSICVWSCSPMGMWWWVLHWYRWLDSKHFPLKSEQIVVELLSVLSLASFMGMPLTAGDSLFICSPVAGWNVTMNLGYRVLYSLGGSPLMS